MKLMSAVFSTTLVIEVTVSEEFRCRVLLCAQCGRKEHHRLEKKVELAFAACTFRDDGLLGSSLFSAGELQPRGDHGLCWN